MFWQECIEKGFVRKASRDRELAKSLIKMSDFRMNFLNKIKIESNNASILTAEAYEAMREVCESIIVTRGFKVYSHECITTFLKEILKNDYLADLFDKYRKIRNGINYYGRQVGIEDAKQAINEISEIINKIKGLSDFP